MVAAISRKELIRKFRALGYSGPFSGGRFYTTLRICYNNCTMLKLEDLADKYQLNLILMFGSRAIGNTHAESDVDISVYGRQILSETEKVQLTYELCNIFRTNDIDLVDLRTASPLLKYEIFKNCKVLFQRDPMHLYRLELANIHEIKELEILYQIRRERLGEFVK